MTETKPIHLWTLADLEAKLSSMGACLRDMRCTQCANHDHWPNRKNWWTVQIGPAKGASRYGCAWAPSLDMALGLAIRDYERYKAPVKITSADQLLKELGL